MKKILTLSLFSALSLSGQAMEEIENCQKSAHYQDKGVVDQMFDFRYCLDKIDKKKLDKKATEELGSIIKGFSYNSNAKTPVGIHRMEELEKIYNNLASKHKLSLLTISETWKSEISKLEAADDRLRQVFRIFKHTIEGDSTHPEKVLERALNSIDPNMRKQIENRIEINNLELSDKQKRVKYK